MASVSSFFISLLFFLSIILHIAKAQDSRESRGHGLALENPMLLSPLAFEFFHPNSPFPNTKLHCSASADCDPLPPSSFPGAFAKPEATQVHGSARLISTTDGTGIGARGIAGIVFSCISIVLLAMGVYHIMIKRRANINRAKTIQPII